VIADALGPQMGDVLIIELADGLVTLKPTRSEVIKHEV
jgi:hypothetical protein